MSFADTELKVIQRLERMGRKIQNPTPEQRERECDLSLRDLQAACGLMAHTDSTKEYRMLAAGAAVQCLVHFAAANDFDLSLAFAEVERGEK